MSLFVQSDANDMEKIFFGRNVDGPRDETYWRNEN